MSDREALLYAIIAAPFEDTPRLAMADWFDENDQAERAEFIRLQVALAWHSNPYTSLTPAVRNPANRILELWRGHGSLWSAELPGSGARIDQKLPLGSVGAGRAQKGYLYARGFADTLLLYSDEFAWGDTEEIFSRLPITDVSLRDRSPNAVANPGWFGWSGASDDVWTLHRDCLPFPLFNRFWEFGIVREGYAPEWRSVDEARAAMSRLLVNHGRALVGLPPTSLPAAGSA